MIKPKILLILLALLGLFLGAWYVIPQSRPAANQEEYRQSSLVGRKLLEGFAPELVRKVVIEREGRAVVLQVVGDEGWKVASHQERPADRVKVFSLLRAMHGAEISDVRTKANGLEVYELDQTRRSTLTVFDAAGKEQQRLWVGKGAGAGKSFVMLSAKGESGEALEATEAIEACLGLKYDQGKPFVAPDNWYEKRLVGDERKEVIGFVVEQADGKGGRSAIKLWKVHPQKGPLKVEKGDIADRGADEEASEDPFRRQGEKSQWKILEPAPGEAEQNVCDRIVAGAFPLNIEGYEDEVKPAELGLEPPEAVVAFTLRNGTVYRIALGKEYKAYRHFRLNESKHVYRSESKLYHELVKKPEELRQTAEGPPKG